jgi:formate dehydrogenase subunit gamma
LKALNPDHNHKKHDNIDYEKLNSLISQNLEKEGPLLPLLHDIQAEFGYIPGQAVESIAVSLNLSQAEVYGVISFYHFFRSQPAGKHTIEVCCAESCQALGGRELQTHAKSLLNVDWHQTTRDKQFTLEPVYCLGNCACSPSIKIDKNVYGRVSKDSLETLLAEFSTQTLSFSNEGDV